MKTFNQLVEDMLDEGGATGSWRTPESDPNWRYGRYTVPLARNLKTGETKFSLKGQLNTLKNAPNAIANAFKSGATFPRDVYKGDAPPAGSKAYMRRAMDTAMLPGITPDYVGGSSLNPKAVMSTMGGGVEDYASTAGSIMRGGKPSSKPDTSKELPKKQVKQWKQGTLT